MLPQSTNKRIAYLHRQIQRHLSHQSHLPERRHPLPEYISSSMRRLKTCGLLRTASCHKQCRKNSTVCRARTMSSFAASNGLPSVSANVCRKVITSVWAFVPGSYEGMCFRDESIPTMYSRGRNPFSRISTPPMLKHVIP